MFRNDAQRCLAIRELLIGTALQDFWTSIGPTDEACERIEKGGGYLSGGEGVLLRVAFDFWNGEGKTPFADVLYRLDDRTTERVIGLMTALRAGSDAVDDFIYPVRS